MFPAKTEYEDKITLIMGSGVQFLDFAVSLELRKMMPGEFLRPRSDAPLVRLQFDERSNRYFHPADPARPVTPEFNITMEQSAKLLKGLWLPLPFFRFNPPRRFDDGPSNWARMRLIELPEPDEEGNTHRVTLAFDTKVFPGSSDSAYLAPTEDDVRSGSNFALAVQANEMGWFLDLVWVNEWLKEVFIEQAQKPPVRMQMDDIQSECQALYHQGHYLNLLHLLGSCLPVPEIKVVSNRESDLHKAIPVDMVLDVGNSRTCGILIEDHPQENDGLSKRYELELRDLTQPEHVYPEPFESRVEFAQAVFGKDHHSVKSGRRDAFLWPTIARVGREAGRLASRRRGTEGSTGLSSPKRYLWDEELYVPGWRFNCAFNKAESEPHATAAPVAGLINEKGQALYTLDYDDRMPVFHPHYSRSSLMTFMLSEVLAQALMQMNSPSQRLCMSHSRVPRHLRSIILTVPPSMPKPEREIFAKCMEQAIGLVWKSMGWHPEDDPVNVSDPASRAQAWPWLPEVHVQWDEATCAQVVYLFNETQNTFAGRPQEFFATLARPDQPRKDRITIASLDIGGGTSDLVVTEYRLDDGVGDNVYINPEQRFRDGFKVAGDDILLDVIRLFVLPPLSDALKQAGVAAPEALLSRLCGKEPLAVQEAVLRQQLTLQVFQPIGLRLLKAYEQYDPLDAAQSLNASFGELLAQAGEQPTEDVLNYFNQAVRRQLNNGHSFNLLDTPINLNLRRIHEAFIAERLNISKSLQALCEVLQQYSCDVLLLTGRPSRLPGIQALFRKLLPLPPGRILPLSQYRTGGWYPFNRQDYIDDPKTTAAVGAMLCLLSRSLRLPNFFFRAAALKPYSTLKYLGLIDNNNVIRDSNLYYRDIDLDNPDYELPEQSFDVRGTMRLGFRQLDCERWTAAPLYTLSIENPRLREEVAAQGLVLKVRLGIKPSRNPSAGSERFVLAGVESSNGAVSLNNLRLTLNTLSDAGMGESQYWLDSGSVFRS